MTVGRPPGHLRREVGLAGAVLLGMGSMVGTGVFVSVGIAAGVAGPAVIPATLAAGLLAAANGISSAQLAAAHPVSGGTYEYGYTWLSPVLGFTAGWMFLLAKSASAATAALGLAGYSLDALGYAGEGLRVPLAAAATIAITAFVAGGIRRSNRANALIVGAALLGLVLLIVTALPVALSSGAGRFTPFAWGGDAASGLGAVLHGSALMFVAFTGYGRIATLGEEVRDPRRVIPRAIIFTTAVVTLLYLGVAAAGVGVLGATAFGQAAEQTAAPLVAVADALRRPWLGRLLTLSALAAMAGVLLNLVLGLSRVLLAMARRRDMPAYLARVDEARSSPVASVWVCGAAIALVTLVGSVEVTWSFSAFTVLVYYAITNLAALRLPPGKRLFPRWIPALGLVGCLGLAFFVRREVWLVGLALLLAGVAWHVARRRLAGSA
ncbi:MAG TPA: amino acid permease [Longimicrobiales bacterium]|nr:amino acid permease [Longimicrobiales bacterium]